MARGRQTSLVFERRGGRRKGAGRPRKDGTRNRGVTHLARPIVKARFPLHVTWRMRREVWNLRSQRCFRVLGRAFAAGGVRDDFRLVHYSVQGNHIHFLVEADDKAALSKAMNGLGVRIASALNRVMHNRRGRVFADRYHARALRTPTEVKNARMYLLNNARHHYGLTIPDEFASQTAFIPPRTHFLKMLR